MVGQYGWQYAFTKPFRSQCVMDARAPPHSPHHTSHHPSTPVAQPQALAVDGGHERPQALAVDGCHERVTDARAHQIKQVVAVVFCNGLKGGRQQQANAEAAGKVPRGVKSGVSVTGQTATVFWVREARGVEV
eukprot:199396-Chlamydomonas_euryale.AAC.5